MPNLTNYAADPHKHQQLVPWTSTSPFDCSPESGGWLADEDSGGKVMMTGHQVRLSSSEPKPDPRSPGLNLPQVDAAVYRRSTGRVNLRLGSGGARPTVSLAYARQQVVEGRSIEWQFHRGRLIQRLPRIAAFSEFDGLHAGGLKLHPFSTLRLFDPLVPLYMEIGWDDVAYAAIDGNGYVGHGVINILATRDVVPSSYHLDVDGPARFNVYRLDATGRIADVKAATVHEDVTRLVARRSHLWFPGVDAEGKPSKTGSYRNAAELLEGALAKTTYRFVNLDNPRLTYRETLP